jgi:TonB family protein
VESKRVNPAARSEAFPEGTAAGPVFDFDSPPRPTKQARPQYPREAFDKRIDGTVLVEALIDTSGRIVRARVIQSVPLLDAAALQAAYRWEFRPAIKNGKPVGSIIHMPVAFRIYGGAPPGGVDPREGGVDQLLSGAK